MKSSIGSADIQSLFLGETMKRVFASGIFLLSFASSAVASGADDPSGVWLTQAGDAKVAISRCGAALCGRVVWLKSPIDSATGKPQIDDKNPNPRLAKRPIMGLQLFIGMRPQGARKWSGRIYNADDGKTYVSNVTLEDDSKLTVQGCVGSLCGGETWSRSKR
jgi:uncharacterized protein (DUF2147 family)